MIWSVYVLLIVPESLIWIGQMSSVTSQLVPIPSINFSISKMKNNELQNVFFPKFS